MLLHVTNMNIRSLQLKKIALEISQKQILSTCYCNYSTTVATVLLHVLLAVRPYIYRAGKTRVHVEVLGRQAREPYARSFSC